MLTGLLFAIEEAVDSPTRLVATLPFAGMSLIEHQARQLVAAGAGQIVIVADRQSPELLGAVHRIGRRGVVVDAVNGAVEAAAMLHPLACVVMLADGLVTTDAVVRLLADGVGDALLVVPADDAARSFERIGGGCAWAGAARIEPARLGDLARLPPDYDPQSTLVRLAEAAAAVRLPLPAAALDGGHGIERDAVALDGRARRLVTAATPSQPGWFDRFVAAPLTRAIVPALLTRRVDTMMVAAAAAVLGIGDAIAIAAGWPRAGLLLAVAAILACSIAIAMTVLRDERRWQGSLAAAILVIAATTVLLLGWRCTVAAADGTALTLAVSLVTVMALVVRAAPAPAIWSADPASCIALLMVATLLGWPLVGLALAACYATVTLAAAVEAFRREA